MAERWLAEESAMEGLGRSLAAVLVSPTIVYLRGPLGAGKTTLVRHLLRAWGHTGAVRSPTYTLVETYTLPGFEVHHLDLYRISAPEELETLGLRDLAADNAIWLIEWAERGGPCLPAPDHLIEIDFDNDGRRVCGLPACIEGTRDT